ncbi:hypothetical protein BCV72DRAFT_303311 [Rhizopus microsporus var. microsporus]|uniref:Uncharacterized protein n=2 Tax=Rhizopus microsporus TaxID=58291 RepID=A0A2G4SQ61_RHIZD|nr:uncharacterized protein RHIMIDRAFT_239361 [Rhizopus microsporus ATCC 52813]ORE08936.1 hypothetical protein BCV72DRAFT_303311 [Rhizopus microsporus var. microsporus]PHZ10536.1 hypothetical protein RHIMIDRAFT_239361 [Rhizopus microsporus ATCC 52813]
MKLAYGYGEITILTNFDVPVHDHKMKDTDENLEEITAELTIRRFIEVLQEEGLSVPVAAKRCMIPRSTVYPFPSQHHGSI